MKTTIEPSNDTKGDTFVAAKVVSTRLGRIPKKTIRYTGDKYVIHGDYECGTRNKQKVTDDESEITCKRCKKLRDSNKNTEMYEADAARGDGEASAYTLDEKFIVPLAGNEHLESLR